MNRRAFLGALTRGLVATAVVVSVPAKALQAVGLTDAAQRYATDYLVKLWREFTKGSPERAASIWHIAAGRELFEAYEGELPAVMRFSVEHGMPGWREESLMLKGSPVWRVGRGWRAEVVTR